LVLKDDWWRQAVVYQIYPRSFKDNDGNGIGDLKGIISKSDYLQQLCVDAIWLSPFYPSSLHDGGYDVDDYRNVDPKIGTLADFSELIESMHSRNIKVFVDIVPNHTSSHHKWFEEALASQPGSAARDRYIFVDSDNDGPPNDWPSHFGPSAWTQVSDGQWYLHLFAPEQPDLNWENAEVREDFLKTLRFWSDLGVDGFRVDVAHGLAKDMKQIKTKVTGVTPEHIPEDGSHPLFDRNEVYEIYESWREVLDSYEPPRIAVAECGAPISRRVNYANSKSLHQAFNFEFLNASWSAKEYFALTDSAIKRAIHGESSSTWVLSNHDTVRHRSRFGLPSEIKLNEWLLSEDKPPIENRELGASRAMAVIAFLLALPGSTYIYQGEELGLPEVVDLPHEALADPLWLRTNQKEKGRDGCRVPLPWLKSAPFFGFSTQSSHLPQPTWFGEFSVEKQDTETNSFLNFYRDALMLRKENQCDESFEWISNSNEEVLQFKRSNGWQCVINFSQKSVECPSGQVILATAPIINKKIPANATVWVKE